MAKSELGTKRIDPETGRKFYDLNKDPIVSPYTGKSYPLSFFETMGSSKRIEEEEETETKEVDTEEEAVEVVSLEEADDETKSDDLPDIEEEDVDLGDEDEDVFLEDEEEDDEDVTGILGVGDDDEG